MFFFLNYRTQWPRLQMCLCAGEEFTAVVFWRCHNTSVVFAYLDLHSSVQRSLVTRLGCALFTAWLLFCLLLIWQNRPTVGHRLQSAFTFIRRPFVRRWLCSISSEFQLHCQRFEWSNGAFVGCAQWSAGAFDDRTQGLHIFAGILNVRPVFGIWIFGSYRADMGSITRSNGDVFAAAYWLHTHHVI